MLKNDTNFINQNKNENNSSSKETKQADFGMLTLGSNEQIEIRKAAEVTLNEAQTYIY
ncbi:hypothetical protein [Intestinibacter sp.]|uniref:hypothetical protein n=1 Tax=Intestinibacter sp. TaxID=1965304 RepID=UPI002A75A122|nr:hypothetical protein [Intestinibacter sp.]MDY2735410.1 hypothetical protein [Intestinibacter sp.]